MDSGALRLPVARSSRTARRSQRARRWLTKRSIGEEVAGALMNDDYTLLTPENVDLRFEVAGVGSRVAAALIDYTILGAAYVVLSLGATFLAGLVLSAVGPRTGEFVDTRI